MGAGQSTLARAVDHAALDAAMAVLSCSELTRGAEHARQLRAVLVLAEAHAAVGWEIAVVPQIALSLGCSENRAARLLTEAQGLSTLPGALEAVECGLLTVEQAATVLEQLAVLDPPGRVVVWQRLQARLVAAADGTVAPPARLAELLGRWVRDHDGQAAARRRREAERSRGVDYRRQSDGLVDLFARGLNGPDAHAILSRIAARSRPWGSQDDRTADQRRLDAFRDLLLGRDQLPIGSDDDPPAAVVCGDRPAGAAPCGCLPGQPVPCGADVAVLMPIGAGLGSTDEVAEQVGHGPLDPDLLEQLLCNGAVLRPVWVDRDGVPVAVGDRTIRLERGSPTAVRETLLELQTLPPPPPQPRHPDDHRPDGSASGAHAPDTPGPYRPPRWLRRLVNLRAPRCEWPGCGARAVTCDTEHDLAWPAGPTCACNLGPCCRRHHRIKQLGWTKTRGQQAAVTWTHPTGRSWQGLDPHEAPGAAVRPPPPIPGPHPLDQLGPDDLDEELWHLGLLPDDVGPWTTPLDLEPADDEDTLGNRLSHSDTRWTLDLVDPYRWDPVPD